MDVKGWREPVPSGMGGQWTWSSPIREAETRRCALYAYVDLAAVTLARLAWSAV